MKLKGKIAVVTGADGGIGREIVKELDKEGAICILVSENKEGLKKLVKELGDRHKYYVSDFSQVKNAVKTAKVIEKNHQKIDFLINAAGIGTYKSIEEVTIEDWQKTLNINTTAPFVFIKLLLPSLKRVKRSVVVSIGSGLGKVPYYPERLSYIVSKFALRGLSLTLSRSLKGENVKFSLITLGSVLTNFGKGGLKKRLELQKKGKKYFKADWVAKKIVGFIKNGEIEDEIELLPERYLIKQ